MALTKITPQMFDTSATTHDFNVDNGVFVVDASANRVGIGTTTPSTLLDVDGTATATTFVGALTGNVTGNVTGNLTGTILTAAQTNITSVGTLSSLTVSGALNGTLSTAAQTNITSLGTLTALTSSGNIIISTGSGTGGRYLILDNTDTGGRDYRLISTNNAHGSLGGGDFAILDNDVSGNDAAKTRLLIDSSGNVGIGTTSPGAILDVNDSGVTNNAWNTLAKFRPDLSDAAAETSIHIQSYPSTTVVADRKAGIQSIDDAGTVRPLLLNKDGGNVGIGTTPDSDVKLHIKGDGARVYVDSADYNLFSIGRRGSSGADLDKAYLRMKNAGTNTVVLDTAGISYFNGGTLAVGTTSTVGSSAEVFVVSGTGSGHSRFAGNSDSYSTVYIKNSSTTANTNQPFLTFQDTGGNRGNFGLRYSTAQLVIQGHGGVGIATGSGGISQDPDVFVTTTGRVGIGSNADSPTAHLTITDENAGQATIQARNFATSATGSFVNQHAFEFRAATSTTTHGMLVALNENNSNRRSLEVADSTGIFATFVQGRLGIGRNNPSARLHLQSTGSATYSGTSAGSNIGLYLTNSESGAAGRTIGIGLTCESNTEIYLNAVTGANNNGGDFVIASRDGGTRGEKLRIYADGHQVQHMDGVKFFTLTDYFTANGSSTTNFKINVSDYTGASANGYCHYTVSVMGYASGGANGLNFTYTVAGYSGHNYSTINYNSYGAGTIANGASGSTQYNSQGISYHPAVNMGGFISSGSVWAYVPAAQQYGVTVVNGSGTAMACRLVVKGWSS